MGKKAMLVPLTSFFMNFVFLDEIDSTQRYAKEHCASFPKNEITCIRAQFQRAGHGTRKSGWLCPKGKGLLLTYVVWQRPSPQIAQVTSCAIGAVCSLLGLAPQLSWPNDVLLSGKKVAGCLVEVQDALLIGIGLNVSQSVEEMEEIDQPATSLSIEVGKRLSPDTVFEQLCVSLEKHLSRFFQEGFSPFYEQYLHLLQLMPGDFFLARIGGHKIPVVFESLEKDGRLQVRDENGAVHFLS